MCNSHDDKIFLFYFLTYNIGFQEPSEIRLLTRFLQMNISAETTPYAVSDTWNSSCSPRSEELIHIAKVTGFYNKPCESANTCGQHWEILTGRGPDCFAGRTPSSRPQCQFPPELPTFPMHGDLFFPPNPFFIQPDYQLPHHHHVVPWPRHIGY